MATETSEEVNGPSSENTENREFKNDELSQALDESGLASLLEKQMSDSQPVPPEPEQPTESEAKPDEEEDSAEDSASADEPEAEKSSLTDDDESEEPAWFQKRIDKLTRQRRDAEDEVKDLRGEMKELRGQVTDNATPASRTNSDSPFEHLTSQEQIDAERQKAKDLRRWCRKNRDGAVINGKNGEVEYDSTQIEDILENAEEALDTHLPEREKFVEASAYWEPEAVKAYPWIEDRGSNENKLFKQALKAFPQVKALPDYKILLGDMLIGRALRISNETSKPESKIKAKAKPKAPKQPAAPSADRTTTPPTAAKISANKNRFLKSGQESDLAELMMDYV
jgi:hypothetical protein